MEEATKTIDTLVKNILPTKAHYLSVDTRRFRQHVDEKRLEEQEIRPLQYTTFVSDAERGILLTRAYFDVREEPANPTNATSTPLPRKTDPNKPKTKLSLKDYKNRKKSPDGEETPKAAAQPHKVNAPLKKLPESVAKVMENRRDGKRETLDTKPELKTEARRHRSPTPERKRRIIDPDPDSKPVKRSRVENATPNSSSSRNFKDHTPQKAERHVSSEKKQLKDPRSIPPTNGKLALNSTGQKGVSPRPNTQLNGSQKSVKGRDGADKKTDSNASSKMPPLLSPIDMSDYIENDTKVPRPSSMKKPADFSNLKPPPKKNRDDREPSPSPKKRKIPPLLSPTLPPIVMEELARSKSTPTKDSSQKSSQSSDSPNGVKKAATSKSTKREETIHVDSIKGQRDALVVTLKYKKRNAKTIERLLALPPGGKKKSDLLKKDDRATRDRSNSLEPSTARKRPFPAAESSEASKRPRTSENMRPSTPPRQSSSAMTRVASNSSQAGTPGVANGLTPAAQPPERRRPPPDPEKLQKLHSRAGNFIQLGTKLKHERDAVLKKPEAGFSERDRQVATAAGIQCLVSFLLGFKLQSDASDMERKPCSTRSFRDTLGLFRVSKSDCARHNQLTALVLRLQGVCLGYIGRILCSYPPGPEFAKELVANSMEQQESWRLSENARKAMGVYDGSSKSDDGGPVGKLIDRIGPWSTAEEAIPITLEVLRKIMQANGPWKPAEALTKLGPTVTNGIIN
ncbi:hypothetical protein F4821DRAFT_71474 [Hypoxylon rubiginosum]|uniref:Uncharacterized protein n=1 Tax=Hypoxylon rubiginosum TaxID=110542 RepID=A0ACC0D920_9PEZI|nr:hypothetical protein F4821DRAFT_71474 [Hypoxylon rubiginosum]